MYTLDDDWTEPKQLLFLHCRVSATNRKIKWAGQDADIVSPFPRNARSLTWQESRWKKITKKKNKTKKWGRIRIPRWGRRGTKVLYTDIGRREGSRETAKRRHRLWPNRDSTSPRVIGAMSKHLNRQFWTRVLHVDDYHGSSVISKQTETAALLLTCVGKLCYLSPFRHYTCDPKRNRKKKIKIKLRRKKQKEERKWMSGNRKWRCQRRCCIVTRP